MYFYFPFSPVELGDERKVDFIVDLVLLYSDSYLLFNVLKDFYLVRGNKTDSLAL